MTAKVNVCYLHFREIQIEGTRNNHDRRVCNHTNHFGGSYRGSRGVLRHQTNAISSATRTTMHTNSRKLLGLFSKILYEILRKRLQYI
jgi:hypothetical protein